MSDIPLIEARGLEKDYRLGGVTVPALRGVDLLVGRGEFVVVAGPSGSGKTTLLNLLGTLDQPDAGHVLLDGVDVGTASEHENTLLRRRRLGFVFQSFNLVPVLSAYENVEYPLWIDGVAAKERRRRVAGALAAVGLATRMNHRPDHLSGGERQRVSIARALVHEPLLVFADEPTASLDSKTAQSIVDLLLHLNNDRQTTFVLATHDVAVIEHARRTIRLSDGAIVTDSGARPS